MKPTYSTLRLRDLPSEGDRKPGLYWICGTHVLGRNEALAAILNQFAESNPPFLPVQIAGAHPGTGDPTFVLMRSSEQRQPKERRFLNDEEDEPVDPVQAAGDTDRDPTPRTDTRIYSLETTHGTEVPRPTRSFLVREDFTRGAVDE